MAKVLMKGDPTTLEAITAALRSAGLSSVEVALDQRRREVTRFPTVPGSWTVLADVAPELAHADWRNEVLSPIDAADSSSARSVQPDSSVTALRRAV